MEKNCLYCGFIFQKPYYESVKAFNERHKYCSRDCFDKSKNGIYPQGCIGYEIKQGQSLSPGTQFKKGSTGEMNPTWQGEDASYEAKHMWIRSNYGSAMVCKLCGDDKARCHWHNISRKYLRDIFDWISLCSRCHRNLHTDNIKLIRI